MPYDGANDSNLPSNVKKLSDKKRKQWVSIFNSSISSGDSEEDAFKKANGGIKNKGYVESLWDLDMRQLPQEKAGYKTFGAGDNKGCANCNWFVSPDTCILVYGDINPSGICNMYMSEDSVMAMVEEEKEASIVERVIEKVKEFFVNVAPNAGATQAAVQGEIEQIHKDIGIGPNPFVFVKQGEDLRFFTAFTNCYKDSHKEIIATFAHKEYVAWADETKNYPELHLWHAGFKSKWGKADWVDYIDGFVCASGLVDRDKQHIAEALGNENIAVSHGLIGLIDSKGVIRKYRTFEISPLPVDSAANVWTNFIIDKESEMPFSEKKRKWLKDVAGVNDDVIKTWEESVDGLATHAKSLGLEFKEDDTTDLAGEIAKLTKTVSSLAEVVVKQNETITNMQKTDEDKIHNAFVAEIAKANIGHSPTEDPNNIVEKKESTEALSWFGDIINSGVK